MTKPREIFRLTALGVSQYEQIEVDWFGNSAQITDPDAGEIIPAQLFVGVMTYSQYPYVEAFIGEKQHAQLTVYVHNQYFGGVTCIFVPDNYKVRVRVPKTSRMPRNLSVLSSHGSLRCSAMNSFSH